MPSMEGDTVPEDMAAYALQEADEMQAQRDSALLRVATLEAEAIVARRREKIARAGLERVRDNPSGGDGWQHWKTIAMWTLLELDRGFRP